MSCTKFQVLEKPIWIPSIHEVVPGWLECESGGISGFASVAGGRGSCASRDEGNGTCRMWPLPLTFELLRNTQKGPRTKSTPEGIPGAPLYSPGFSMPAKGVSFLPHT